MVSFTVTTRFQPEDREHIDELVRLLTLASRDEAGCVSYTPHWLREEPATLMIYEQYVDQAALDAHHATPHVLELVRNGLDKKLLSREYVWLEAIL
jgi:quinol monooxygenase YgiN